MLGKLQITSLTKLLLNQSWTVGQSRRRRSRLSWSSMQSRSQLPHRQSPPSRSGESVPSVEEVQPTKFDSPYLILAFEPSTKKVTFSPMSQPNMDMPKSTNMIHLLGGLKNASEFLKHFQAMHDQGYSLYNGIGDMLIFQKEQLLQDTASAKPQIPADLPSVAEKATPTPVSEPALPQPEKKAATVLEELPTELDPPPGPAAPTAPTPRPFTNKPKVRRQEVVFSGTIRPNAASVPSRASEEKPSPSKPRTESSEGQKQSLWRHFTRAIRRTVLTVTALAAGAYTIGFVAEGLGAHAQQQKGVENADAPGPRKRIVMTGQRPGIYSTESSR